MADSSGRTAQDALLSALRRVFAPILRMCFRYGVSMAQVRSVLDRVAVREAEKYLMDASKKPTFSKISLITGIERRTVAQLLAADVEENELPTAAGMHRAARVLNGWHEDPTWTTSLGTPAVLDIRGEGNTFETLATRYGGGVTAGAILEWLLDTNTIEVVARDEDDRPTKVRPLQSTIAPDVDEARLFDEFGTVVSEAVEMFDGNLRTPHDYERMRPYTVTAMVVEPKLRVIRRQLRERGESLQTTVDEALEQHDLLPREVKELTKKAPSSLYSVRVTLFSTIRQAIAPERVVESAWRRDPKEDDDDGDPREDAARPANRRAGRGARK